MYEELMMLTEQNNKADQNPVDAAMAWHGGDPRATIEALLQDRIWLQEQLAIAKACMGKGYTRGWMPGAEFEQ
ncbi:dehydrogenase [Rhizobium leguminosarum]|uniref:dehydrogenase n=2 Tax=Rhizobium/Agrobacterium group TaxID=227290 RepID=UPI0010304A4B|nr:dehydrogenase [Rhizobium leguminosarum]NEJ21637.1 dehydrogenase [Rhizobium leguminosarum]TAY38536.1 dehydrogenase [Rhizobium leguminosarum]